MQDQINGQREQTLLRDARHDSGAFQELYAHYFPKVYAYIGWRIGRVEDIEDIVADTFLSAVEDLNNFEWRGNGSFGAWLFRIARNKVSSFYRKEKREPPEILLEELPEIPSGSLLPPDSALQKEQFAQLRRLIATLSPRWQEVITLKFFAGLRNNQIAQMLGVGERTVAAYLSRGLAELHQKYLEETHYGKEQVLHEEKD